MSYGELPIYEKLLRKIRERRDRAHETLIGGIVPDFNAFQVQRAILRELNELEQELKTLLDKASQE